MPFTLTPVSPAAARGRNASQADLEDLFGRSAVARWSQFSDSATDADVTRIQRALDHADATIDNEFRDGPYALPLLIGTDRATVTRWAAAIAGVWLYAASGSATAAASAAYTALLDQVTAEMARYKSGANRLDAAPNQAAVPNAPTIL